jgi:hypothetical protein
MSYTLGQAAKACGRSKMTIARAVKSGRISAARTATGVFAIDPAELHRVYPRAGNGAGSLGRDATGGVTSEPAVSGPASLGSLAALLVERDRLVTEQAETIRDLRSRLDAEAEERRRLTALLTGPRAPYAPASAKWWRRWLR